MGTGFAACKGMPAHEKPLRIAQVAPLFESVPPRLYGGTERVVSYLTEELVRQGHRVTLFASGDSSTSANLVPIWDRALRLDPRRPAAAALHTLQIEEVFRRADDFDVIHCHLDSTHLPMARRSPVPVVTTLHGRLDSPGLERLHREYAELPMVSISNAQREPLRGVNWAGTVYHGLPLGLYRPSFEPGSYLAFIGRLSPEKRVDRAIAIARRTGLPLVIAAKVDEADRDYFVTQVEPHLDGPRIHFVGEINEWKKSAFLGGALALLFLIDWPEPFGLAMIEALACGTPVIAFRCGSVPEVIDQGETGFIVDSLDEAVQCVGYARHLDRRHCRYLFEQRFSVGRMAHDYCEVYAACGDRPCRLRA
jgi:glycosyltransferase involved in cell wall biosynthesis